MEPSVLGFESVNGKMIEILIPGYGILLLLRLGSRLAVGCASSGKKRLVWFGLVHA